MHTIDTSLNSLSFLSGGGEMGELTRKFNWSATSLGSPKSWSPTLRVTLSILLSSKFPMILWWGKDLHQFYNDSYRISLGNTGKHPQALGQKAIDCWPEVWDVIQPLIVSVMENGESVLMEDQLIPIFRNGRIEDVYWTFGYSPVTEENGHINGVLVTVIETTEKQKAIGALKQSEIHYRSIIDLLPLVVWTADTDGALTYISQQWSSVYGNAVSESLGTGWVKFVHADDVEKAASQWTHSLSTGKPYETEFRVMHEKDGYRWVLVRAIPVYNDEGEIISWNGSNTDIHDKKIIEHTALESEQRFRAMADNIPNLAWMANADGWIYWYNKKWYEYTGTVAEQMEGWGWQSVHDPNELPKVMERWQASIATGKNFEMVFPLKGADGIFRSFLTRVLPVYDDEGKITQWFGSNTDITEQQQAEKALKESERNLRQTIIQAPVAMCILRGEKFVVELANELMFELWGKPSENLLYKPIFEGLPEAKDQGFEELLEGVYTTGKAFSAIDVPITLPRNGQLEKVYINFVYEAYHEADGSVSGILVVATDVTEQVLARHKIEDVVAERTKELARANENLQKSNAELAQFAYIASHDLQEPLRKISTFSQMLEHKIGDKLDEQSKNYLNKIHNASARMTTLIRDVLNYSELVKESQAFTTVDLNEIMEVVKTDYELLIAQKKAVIRYDKLPVIEAIQLQMVQLFGNLIGNALKFSRKDVAPVINISAVLLEGNSLNGDTAGKNLSYYKISFRDNGIGFKEEYANQIFHIFQRLHRKSEYEGTGIGLAMCKKIALNHQGDLDATGSSEEGALFNLILPVKQEAETIG